MTYSCRPRDTEAYTQQSFEYCSQLPVAAFPTLTCLHLSCTVFQLRSEEVCILKYLGHCNWLPVEEARTLLISWFSKQPCAGVSSQTCSFSQCPALDFPHSLPLFQHTSCLCNFWQVLFFEEYVPCSLWSVPFMWRYFCLVDDCTTSTNIRTQIYISKKFLNNCKYCRKLYMFFHLFFSFKLVTAYLRCHRRHSQIPIPSNGNVQIIETLICYIWLSQPSIWGPWYSITAISDSHVIKVHYNRICKSNVSLGCRAI